MHKIFGLLTIFKVLQSKYLKRLSFAHSNINLTIVWEKPSVFIANFFFHSEDNHIRYMKKIRTFAVANIENC